MIDSVVDQVRLTVDVVGVAEAPKVLESRLASAAEKISTLAIP